MYIIMKNDFPHSVCPDGTTYNEAIMVAQHFQNQHGLQIGLCNRAYFHVIRAEIIAPRLIEKLKGNQNGS